MPSHDVSVIESFILADVLNFKEAIAFFELPATGSIDGLDALLVGIIFLPIFYIIRCTNSYINIKVFLLLIIFF